MIITSKYYYAFNPAVSLSKYVDMTSHLMNMLPTKGISYGFLSNEDGASQGMYESLNCGPGSNDDTDLVFENRRIAANIISGRRDTPLVSCYQVHGNSVVDVNSDWGDDRPKADAMATRKKGLLLGILTADCTPVLFMDATAHVIGAAHAGWKGALGGVLENTLTAMERLGAARGNITAMIGPTIHQQSYEVSSDFRETFLNTDKSYASFFADGKDSSHFQFDLPGFVKDRLNHANVGTIWHADIDTYTSEHHFSFRRTTHRGEPDYGRQVSAIMLTP